jgi:hypothetical protein
MAASAWQLVCGLDAWRVTQIPRRPARLPSAGTDDDGDLLAAQRAAALSAAYHGGAGPVGFAWVRDRPGGPVQVPCWVRIAGVADSLLADGDPRPGSGQGANGIRPSLEDGWLAAALQVACRDGPDGRHPRSAEWERDYGRSIPGQDGAAQLETVTRWHQDDQRDAGRLHVVAWGQRPEAALASAIGAKPGEADWDERVASQLSCFTAPCWWPLDHLTLPGPGHE